MVKNSVMCSVAIVACVSKGAAAFAQDAPRATVVYDVKLREFRCWHEGNVNAIVTPSGLSPATPRSKPCQAAYGWHPVTSDLYFVRGQAVSILLVNAMALD